MRSLMRFLPCLALLLLVPLASCTEASAVTLSAFGAAQAGDSLRLSATFHLDPSIDSGAATFRVKTASKRIKLAAVATGASAKFALPAEGETVTGYLTLTLWKAGTAPVSVSDSVRYTRPVTPIVPPVIDGFTAEQAAAIIDSSPLVHYASYYPSATSLPCHAEMRQYVSPSRLLVIPPVAERPHCDTVLAGLASAAGATLADANGQVVAEGRALPDSMRQRWRSEGNRWPVSHVAVMRAACATSCPAFPAGALDWPVPPDSTTGTEYVWMQGA